VATSCDFKGLSPSLAKEAPLADKAALDFEGCRVRFAGVFFVTFFVADFVTPTAVAGVKISTDGLA
jgi:hypothetical protein